MGNHQVLLPGNCANRPAHRKYSGDLKAQKLGNFAKIVEEKQQEGLPEHNRCGVSKDPSKLGTARKSGLC